MLFRLSHHLAAMTLQSLLVFRGLVGVGLGGVPVAFTMLAEITPAQYRGTFLILLEIFWSFGAVFQAGIAWAILPHSGWRTLLIVSALPLGGTELLCHLLCVLLLGIP